MRFIPNTANTIELKLYDSYQTQSLLQTHILNTGDNIIPIDVSLYPSGLYTFTVEVDGVIVTSKHLVIIH